MTNDDTRCRHACYARAIRQLRRADADRRRAEVDASPYVRTATARAYVTAWRALVDLDDRSRTGKD